MRKEENFRPTSLKGGDQIEKGRRKGEGAGLNDNEEARERENSSGLEVRQAIQRGVISTLMGNKRSQDNMWKNLTD